MEIVNDPNCKSNKYIHSYMRSTVAMVFVTLMVRTSCNELFSPVENYAGITISFRNARRLANEMKMKCFLFVITHKQYCIMKGLS